MWLSSLTSGHLGEQERCLEIFLVEPQLQPLDSFDDYHRHPVAVPREKGVVFEIKTARATSPYLARGLRAIMQDTGAISATVIDQGQGTDPLAPGVSRMGFERAKNWLPDGLPAANLLLNTMPNP
jgi:hypothetical protein